MKDKIVYSTDPDFLIHNEINEINEKLLSEEQNLRIWLEKRPGNKIVSIIRGFIGTESELKDLSKLVKKRCSVGGSVKAGEIIIQTKDRQKLLQILNNLGYFAKLSGG
ncbi:translation initiation factor [bacterium]|nr:translation initiation factor [bacterium]